MFGYYPQTRYSLRLWDAAKKLVLCGNFFKGAFGASYLNHQYLIGAQVPLYSDASDSVARSQIAPLQSDEPTDIRLKPPDKSPASRLGPVWRRLASHIDEHKIPKILSFQYHHQPFNYLKQQGPENPIERKKRLRDGGLGDEPSTNHFLADADEKTWIARPLIPTASPLLASTARAKPSAPTISPLPLEGDACTRGVDIETIGRLREHRQFEAFIQLQPKTLALKLKG